jgi:sugar/nucleoside kinase (ribokinase family)
VEHVADTTGAGDLFAAGCLFGLTHGYGVEEALRLGAFAAGEVIGHLGARPATGLREAAAERSLTS